MADVIGGIVAELSAQDNLSGPFDKARQAMAALEAEMRRLQEEEKQNIITTADLNAKLAQLTAEQNRLQAAMTAAAPRVNSVDSALGGAARRSGDLSRGLLEVSRGIEDFTTGGPIGVLNNIPGIFTSMASAAGVSSTAVAYWTAGVSVAATGAYVLYKNWDSISSLWEEEGTLSEAERMKELGKQTKLTADETMRLADYKRRQSTAKDQDERRPKAEGEVTKIVKDAVGEMGAAELKAQIRAKLLAGNGPISERELNAEVSAQTGLRNPGDFADDPDLKSARDKAAAAITKRRNDAAMEAANKLLADAETGPGELGVAARRKLGELLPGAEGDVFRAQSPDARDAAETARLTVEGQAGEAAHDKKVKDEQTQLELKGSRQRRLIEQELEAKAKAERGNLAAREQDDAAENAANFREEMERKIERGLPLTFGEGEALPPDLAKKLQEKNGKRADDALKRDESLARLQEYGSDLDWRLRSLLNPDKVGKSMGLDAFEASIKATTGVSEEVKKLRDIELVSKEIRDNTSKIRAITRIPR